MSDYIDRILVLVYAKDSLVLIIILLAILIIWRFSGESLSM